MEANEEFLDPDEFKLINNEAPIGENNLYFMERMKSDEKK
jgi:hypothetical protein